MKGKMQYAPNLNPFDQLVAQAKQNSQALCFRAVNEFTQAIAKRMADLNVTRLKLAQRLQVHPSFVTKVLKGDSNISVETMAKFCYALECSFHICIEPKVSTENFVDAGYTQTKTQSNTIRAGQPALVAFRAYRGNLASHALFQNN